MALPRKKAAGYIPRFAKGNVPKGDDGMGGGGMFLALSSASMALNTMSASGDEAGGALSGLAETASKAVNALLTFQTLSFVTGGRLGKGVAGFGKSNKFIRGMKVGAKGKAGSGLGFGVPLRGAAGAGAKVGAAGAKVAALAAPAAAVIGSIAGLSTALFDLGKTFKGAADDTFFYGKVLGGSQGKFQAFFNDLGNSLGINQNIEGMGKGDSSSDFGKKLNIANIGGMNSERANLKRQLSGLGGKAGIDLFNETFAGQQDEVNAAFKSYETILRASAQTQESGRPTDEARIQATKEFNERLKKLGGITKETIFQQTDFNRRQKFLNDEIGRLRSRIKNAGNTPQMRDIQNSAMISSNMKDRADIMGALQFSGDFAPSVGAAVNAAQRGSTASDALMQKRALQAQLLTETDPKKRADLEKGIEDAGKNFANIVKESSINFANNIVALEKQMEDATNRRVDIINSTLQRDTSKRRGFLGGGAQDRATVMKLFANAEKAQKRVDEAEAFARKGGGSRAFVTGMDPVKFKAGFDKDRQKILFFLKYLFVRLNL